MGVFAALPPDYETWTFPGGSAVARRPVAESVRHALAQHRTLYEWAARQPGREIFAGRGEAYGVRLGATRAVVRHARRGGALASLLGDRYLGAPRFRNEIDLSHRLAAAGIPTPAVLAGVTYPAGLIHRADVATERVDGTDLATIFYGEAPPTGEARTAILRAVGALVRRLHDACFVHADLQLRNVLVGLPSSTALPPYRPTAWLLDIDTCRRVSAGDEASRRANLARFDRSWQKWNEVKGPRLTAGDRSVFLAGYHGTAA